MAVSSQELKAIISLQDAMTPKLKAIEEALDRLGSKSKTTGASVGQMAGGIALGTVAAHALMGAINATVGAFTNAAGGALALSSRLEQAKIGFTTMLGSASKANQMIGELQSFAESTPFDFPGIQQVSQSFLAMGIDAKNVIPILSDVSNALAAAGHGGDTEALQRVGQSFAEISAQGKVTGEQLRELSRNGIAVLPILAAAFGRTTAEVRKMAEEGEISANQFFAAFHSEVALRYGDIGAQQAKTWAVAISNLGDIIGRISTQTLEEFFGALTRGALILNDFLHSERVQQWAADFKQSIHEVLTALAPLGEALARLFGGGAGAPAAAKPAAAKALVVPAEAIKSADDYAAKIKVGEANIHSLTASLTALSERQNGLRNQIEDIKAGYAAILGTLRTQQEGINAEIDATKAKYEAILTPLTRMQAQLNRLAEDTKAAFAAILDPLKAQLDGVNTKIGDTKAAFEAATRPIQAQIDAINKANNALKTQRDLVVKIADISLREKQLASLGDPKLRASIASQMKTLEIADEYLNIQKDQLDLGNKKGNNDKAIASVQSQLDANRSKELALQKQLLDAADKPLQAQIAGQEVLNKAQADALKIAQDKADLDAAAKTAPLEEQLAAAKAQLATLLDPLEAQAAALEKMIKSVSATEAAALAPITAAQTTVARAIEDTTQAMQDALAPLEAAAKTVADAITATEAAQRKALEPLEAQQAAMERQSRDLEQQKKQIADKIAGWKDEAEAIKAAAAETAKITAALDLSGGGPDIPEPGTLLPIAPIPKSLIPPETIQSFKDLATNVESAATAFDHLNVSTGGGLLAGIGAVGKFLAVFAGVGLLAGKIEAFTTALNLAGLAAATTQAFWAAWAIFVVASIETVKKEWDATDWSKVGADLQKTLADMQTAWGDAVGVFKSMGDNLKGAVDLMLKDSREGGSNPFPQMAEWFKNFPGDVTATVADVVKVFSGMGTNLKAAGDLMMKPTSEGGSNPFPDLQKSIDGFLASVKPVVDNIVKAFDPLAAVLKTIGDAITTMPTNIPGWLSGLLGLIRGGGGGNVQTAFRPGQSGGWSDIPPGAAGVLSGGTKDEMIANAARQFGIDEATFWRQIQQESGNSLDTNLTSSAGARGPGQFMPGTAQEAANMLGVSIDEFWSSAELQIQGAAAEMAKYVQQFGSYRNALIAYNAGPGAVGNYLPAETAAYLNSILPNGEPMGGGTPNPSAGANRLMSYTPSPAWDPKMSEAQAAAEKALADAQARLNEIMAAGAPIMAAANAATSGAVAPAQQFATALDGLYNSVANGKTPLGTLQLQLVALAAKAGEQGAAGELDALISGTESTSQALENLAAMAGGANPEIAALVANYRAAGGAAAASESDTAKFALDLLNIRKNAEDAATAVAAATAAQTATGGKTGASPIDAQITSFDALKPKIDAASESLKNYQIVVQALDPSKIAEQTSAIDTDREAVDKLSEGLHNLADFLDDHEFHVQVKVDDIPDWATPGSPTPFEMGLRGIKRAADRLKPISLMSSDQPLLTPASRSAAFSGGGGGGINVAEITINGTTDPAATARAVRNELVKLGRRNGGGGKVLS